MKKKVALILVAAAMLLSACSSASSAAASSEATTSEQVTSEATSTAGSVATDSATSSVAGTSSVASGTSSTAGNVSGVSSTGTSTTSKASSTKTSSSSKASTTSTSTTGGAIGKIGSNPTCGLPATLTICKTGFFGESTDNPDQKSRWQDILSKRYGVAINVLLPPKASVNEFLSTRIAAGDLKGVVYRYSPDDVINAMYQGIILPIDDYLKDNKTWNSLPEAMRNNYKINGHIWAVPANLSGYGTGGMWSRYFRKDWLTALKLDTPKTVDDTKNVCTQFATKDPDGDGTNSDNIGITFGSEMTWMDLFAAQGALLFEQGSNIGYHPVTKAYEDAYLRPGAKSVFELFRYFYQNKYCDTTALTVGFTDLRTKLNSGVVGSVFFYGNQGKYSWGPNVYDNILRKTQNRKHDYNAHPEDWTNATNIYTEVSMITGTETKNTWFTTTDGGPFTLMKGTPQPKETINFFVDLMFSSENAFIEAQRNTNDTWSKNSDGTFTMQYKDAATKTAWASAGLDGYVEPNLYPSKVYSLFYPPDVTAADKQHNVESTQYGAARDAKGLADGQLYTIKPEYKTLRSTTYQNANGDAYNYAKQLMISAASDPNMTVDQALAQYKKNMAALGGDKMLKEMNDSFGFTNNYQSYSK